MPRIIATAFVSVAIGIAMVFAGVGLYGIQAINPSIANQEEEQQQQDNQDQGNVVELAKTELSSESTDILRSQNLQIAAKAINGTKIEAERGIFTMSTLLNDYVETNPLRTTKTRAASSAAVDADGVAQVTSALYNAALKAGLTVTTRHASTTPCDYIETGLEATGDLKIKNPYPTDMTINAEAKGQTVTVTISGENTTPGITRDVVARIVGTSDSSDNYSVQTYVITYKNGVKTSEKKVDESSYSKDDATTSSATGSNSTGSSSKDSSTSRDSSSSKDSSSSSSSKNPVPSRGGTSTSK